MSVASNKGATTTESAAAQVCQLTQRGKQTLKRCAHLWNKIQSLRQKRRSSDTRTLAHGGAGQRKLGEALPPRPGPRNVTESGRAGRTEEQAKAFSRSSREQRSTPGTEPAKHAKQGWQTGHQHQGNLNVWWRQCSVRWIVGGKTFQ